MWVKSGETVSEISSELSPISISGRVELRNLHSLSDQKKLLSISRTKHILVFNMSVWFWRTLSKCFKFVSKSVDLQLWSVYHGRQWFVSETQVTKTMLEKSLRKKRFSEIWALLVYMWIRPYVQFRGIHSSSDFSPIQCSRNVLLGDLRQLDPSHQDGHCKWIQILKTLVKGDGGFRYLEQKFVGFTF